MNNILIRVLIIGGYGNFGSTIARRLALNNNIQLYIGGRSHEKATNFCQSLTARRPVQPVVMDITKDITSVLSSIKPDLVIHTSGPFQGQGYDVAKACIACGVNYCDLADGRDFVSQIGSLDAEAKDKGVAVIVGASSVPTLTAAIMDELISRELVVKDIDYGIATAQQTRLGQATTASTLSYAGRKIKTLINKVSSNVYGWQDIHVEKYPILGNRLMSNTDIPDLDLFPARYPTLETQRFYAGVEVKILQLGIWILSWFVRLGIVKSLTRYAGVLAKSAGIFDFLGTDSSGFHFHAKGQDKQGKNFKTSFYLIAQHGDGPNIPCVPSIWVAEQMALGQRFDVGAYPCVGMMTLQTYLSYLESLDIQPIWQDT